jgi:hypothetical protein
LKVIKLSDGVEWGRMTCEDATRKVRERESDLEKSRKTNKQREDTVKTAVTRSAM